MQNLKANPKNKIQNMNKTLLTTAVIIAAGMSVHAQTQGTPPGFAGQPNPYGNVDSTKSTYTTTPVLGDSLTLALNVTPHYSATPVIPPVNSPGVGVYDVATGTGVDSRSFWNFDLGANSSLGALPAYDFKISVLNVGNGESTTFDTAGLTGNTTGVSADGIAFGNGESLDFTLTDPAFFGSIGYDPTANDDYDITLTAYLVTGAPVASDSIEVVAGNGVPDAVSTMGLLSASVAALGFVSRRFRK
jgi:hypothetical protein